MKKLTTFILALIILSNCGSSNSVIIGPDPAAGSDVPFITLRAIDENGDSQVEIPLSTFGETEEIMQNTTFDITINEFTRNQNVAAEDFYVAIVDRVAFKLHGLEDGDSVTFTLHKTIATSTTNSETNSELALSISPLPFVEDATDADTQDDVSITAIPVSSTAEVVDSFFQGSFSSTEDTSALLVVLDLSEALEIPSPNNVSALITDNSNLSRID